MFSCSRVEFIILSKIDSTQSYDLYLLNLKVTLTLKLIDQSTFEKNLSKHKSLHFQIPFIPDQFYGINSLKTNYLHRRTKHTKHTPNYV